MGPRAVLRVPAVAGTLRLRLWAPRPTSPETRLRVGGEWVAGPIDPRSQPVEVAIELPPVVSGTGRAEIEIESVPYLPAAAGSDERRELGVVLSRLAFVPLTTRP